MEHTAGATATSGEMGGASAPWGQPRLGGQPRPHAAVAPPELNVSKRPRSFTSEYATEPLHPHKQQSDPHGMAVQGGISAGQIRQLIQTQRRLRMQLHQQSDANARQLIALQQTNLERRQQLERLREQVGRGEVG
eukprot:CAMPEP_0181244684 /NCGR_PEP_ID=MMETSP1096-20121128/42997_1 /TAXON_ID=156174 ORGANISM="Chrysochromulina ericina, Strain CCMP281" /NCGR_SAMPLE_ID=MMETSP1096 /ASSEMBLY_ACC=CAM_ASM_000453 /LENGTH=134 /DNA_ID=CAMNT_0023341261 /DNA_START=30 /DNA_END=434 /DNA_ORIENTATION=-